MAVIIGSGVFYLAVGIACLVISQKYPTPCGLGGNPPLWQWVFGTGISYTVIGACLGVVGVFMALSVVLIIPWLIVIWCSAAFTFAWMIVGAVSLWRDGGDCVSLNFPLWQMGMAAVIISIVMCVFGTPLNHQSTQKNN
jgi:hypothetical protein